MPRSSQIARRNFMAAGAATIAAGATVANLCPLRDMHSMVPEDFHEFMGSDFMLMRAGEKLTAKLMEVVETQNWRPKTGRKRSFLLIFSPLKGHLPEDGIYHCFHPQIGTHDVFFSNFGRHHEFQTSFS